MLTPLLALGFANLAMLGWLAAAAAPILIHLWMRQTHRETAWAAVRFLRAALEKQARRLRLQHWILLAVRTLLLVLVALAAAKPLVDSGLLGAAIPTHRVLVIDASLSMSARSPDGETAFDRAKRAAVALAEQGRAGDSCSVLVMGSGSESPTGRPTPDAGAAIRAINAIAPAQGTADVAGALAAAKRQIEVAQNLGSTERHEVLFFTDLGANSWSGLEDDAGAAAYESLAEVAGVTAVDVGGARRANVAVTSIALDGGLPSLAAPVEVRAEARLFGGEPAERVAQLLVSDRVVAEQPITLTPGPATPIDFVHTFRQPGPRAVSVRLTSTTVDADPLTADDRRWLGLTLPERVRVLCVAGAPGACDYLADALDPTGEGALEPVVVYDADLPTVDFSEYACVFLSNVSELSAAEAQRLARYVESGGGVAWFLGDRVLPSRYNEALAPAVDQLGKSSRLGGLLRRVAVDEPENTALLPGRLAPSVAVSSYRLDPLDYEHPIVRPFRGQERTGLLTTPVARHFPLQLSEGAGASIALALENGDPLLVTSEVGRGRVAVLTTAASLASVDPATGEPWTTLPAWPSFLPIVRGLVLHLAEGGSGAMSLRIGDTLEGVAGGENPGQVAIASPEGAETTITPDDEGVWRHGPLAVAGVYRVGPAGDAPSSATAVNADPAESDPARVDADLLPDSLIVSQGPTSSAAEATGATAPLHRWLLLGALGLALVEPALACWFGRRDA